MARRRSRGRYRLTAKRRVALRKAQMVSARKRKAAPNKKVFAASNKPASGFTKRPAMSTKKKILIGGGVATAAVLGAGVYRHKASGSSLSIGLHKRKFEGEMVAHQVYRGPLTFDEHGFRTGGGTTSEMQPFVSPGEFKITRRGMTIKRRGHRSLDIAYSHKPLTKIFGIRIGSGGAPPQAKGIDRRKPHLSQAEKDAQQVYFPHGPRNTPAWPFGSEENIVKQNVGLREGTHEIVKVTKAGHKRIQKRKVRAPKKKKYTAVDPRIRAMDDPLISRFLGPATKRAREL